LKDAKNKGVITDDEYIAKRDALKTTI
jgi:hypothetical protein